MSEAFTDNNKQEQVRVSEEIAISIEKQEQKLLEKLWVKLWISKESAKSLSELKSIKNRADLRKELKSLDVAESKFDEEKELDEIQDLLNQINGLREQIHSNSRVEIASLNELLKEGLETKQSDNNSLSKKVFSEEYLAKIQKWEKFSDNLIWASIWAIDSVYKLWVFTKDVWIWIIKFPYDLYKIATKKSEYDWFKDM